MRARRPKNLQQSYEKFGSWVEGDPASWRGSWHSFRDGMYRHVHLDLGCGKGGYAVEHAKRHTEDLVVGIDSDEICVARCAELAGAESIPNCIFLLADATMVPMVFSDGEVDFISINFPTPLPRKKHAEQRLVHAKMLLLCRRALDDGGMLRFKTDSRPLFDFSLSQFPLAGFEIVMESTTYDSAAAGDIETLYEGRAKELGASICMLEAAPVDIPVGVPNNVSMSLVDYLPEDLEAMEYVPFGMEDTVFNLRNRQARQKRHKEKSRQAECPPAPADNLDNDR